MNNLPQEHIEENLELEGDAYVDLYQIVLQNGTRLYLKADDEATWQGNNYEGTGIIMTAPTQKTGGEVSRPTLSLANPEGIFTPIIADGDLDRATVLKYKVLRKHIDTDQAIYQSQTWIIWRTVALTNQTVQFELRNQLDGQNFTVPARVFIPPNFPWVSLS
jgi:lambda family phage minor tail protein L